MRNRVGAAILAALVLPGVLLAQEIPARRQYGASFGIGLGIAPLGEVGESYGSEIVPGLEYDIRLFTRSPRGTEWNLGVLNDRYEMEPVLDINTRSAFEYTSTSVVVGFSKGEVVRAVPMRFGADLGWRHFDASSSRPNYYTGEVESSGVEGDAAVAAVHYSIEFGNGATKVLPRFRMEMSFPDFGGGDGYSLLHRETDVGFRASMGIGITSAFFRR